MKIVVTGGCGFIGSHLVHRLLQLDHTVIVIDNNFHGHCYHDQVKLLPSLRPHRLRYHTNSICDDDIYKIFEDVECVFHLAAEARIQASIENPQYTSTINISGTVNILEACRINKVPRFINSSSSSVYGLTDRFPTNETTKTDCLNPYAASKLAAEEMINCYAKLYNIKAFNLRYFNVFGENSKIVGPYSLVIGLFLDQYKRGENLTVVGDGGSLRDFVYVGDVVYANIKAMTAESDASSETLNIGSGSNISILDIARTISPNNITHVPYRSGEAKQTLADISHAKFILNWEPKIRVIDWIKHQINEIDKNI